MKKDTGGHRDKQKETREQNPKKAGTPSNAGRQMERKGRSGHPTSMLTQGLHI